MSTSRRSTSPPRSDSKMGILSKIKTGLKAAAAQTKLGFFDLPLKFRRRVYHSLLPEILIQDLDEIKDVFQLRRSVMQMLEDAELRWDDLSLQAQLEVSIEKGRLVSAEKASFLLANPEAAYEIRRSISSKSYLYVEADCWSICGIIWLMLNLGLSRIVVDFRWGKNHDVRARELLVQTAKRAGVEIESLVWFYEGCGVTGYSWVNTVNNPGHKWDWGEGLSADEAERIGTLWRCDSSGTVGCWCESRTKSPVVDRREIIARNTEISESFRAFLGQLQADDEDDEEW